LIGAKQSCVLHPQTGSSMAANSIRHKKRLRLFLIGRACAAMTDEEKA
jgi:hypothetical protein